MLLTVVASGCQKEQKVTRYEKTQITLWHYWDGQDSQNTLKILAQEYNQSQKEVKVKLEYIPDGDFNRQLALSTAEGNMPDIALVDSSDFMFFDSMNSFADLTDEIPELEAYSANALASCTVGGRIKGLPAGLNCTALFYNKKMLNEKGCEVPLTWDAFYRTAKAFADGPIYGTAISALRSEESLYQFLPMFWSMGADVYSVDSQESREAFQLLADLVDSGSMSRQVINLTMNDIVHQFAQGNVAMIFASSGDIGKIQREQPQLDFGVTRIPADGQACSVIGGEVFGVAKGEHQKEAVEFLRYIADKERMESYMDDLGFLAPRDDVMEQQFKDEPLKRIFIDICKTARLRDLSADWPRISLILSQAMEETIAGEKELDTILPEAEMKISEIMEGGQ